MKRHLERPDPWVDRLSEYLDGELSRRDRGACEEHVARCSDCAALLEQLRRVVARAGRLNRPIEPGRDMWPAVARRLSPRPAAMPPWRFPTPVWLRPRLVGAAVIAVACLAGATWFLHVRSERPVQQVTAPASSLPAPVIGADHEYERTVANLHRQAHARLTLDPHLIEVLDENLATLDAAIATYRDALAEDPTDRHLRSRLDAARQRKLEVLQQAVALASEGTE